ncbi:hypothetical protein N2M06_06040 [Oceanimonas sp. AH20CE76]|uniref:hypothetical protein n=1 Tax=Oceanimonas sp. AH20CE76 TaxID=2977120 RepID=UPI0031FEF5A5
MHENEGIRALADHRQDQQTRSPPDVRAVYVEKKKMVINAEQNQFLLQCQSQKEVQTKLASQKNFNQLQSSYEAEKTRKENCWKNSAATLLPFNATWCSLKSGGKCLNRC